MKFNAGFKCNDCGGIDFDFAHDPPQDDDVMTCAGCKRSFGKYGDVKALLAKYIQANGAQMDAEANKRIEDQAKKI